MYSYIYMFVFCPKYDRFLCFCQNLPICLVPTVPWKKSPSLPWQLFLELLVDLRPVWRSFLRNHSFFRSDRRYCVYFFPMATCPNPGMEKTCSDFCSNRRYSYSCMMFLIYRLSKPVPHIHVDVILVTKKGVLSINIVKVPKEKRRHANKHGLLSLCR